MAKPPRLFTSEEKKRKKNHPSLSSLSEFVCVFYLFQIYLRKYFGVCLRILFYFIFSPVAAGRPHHTLPPDLISSSPPPHQRNPPPPPPSPIFLSNPPPPPLRSLPLPSSALPDGRRIGLRRRPQLSDHDGHLRRPPEHPRHGC